MTDDAKPDRPPPWRWVEEPQGPTMLVDATGAVVLAAHPNEQGWALVEIASPVVRAVTELAPQLADALDEAMGWLEDPSAYAQSDGRAFGMKALALLALLARLDAARKANP